MTDRKYKNARAMEMAVKEAAKKSGQDVSKAIEAYYASRLLERVFSEPEPAFVLKGGRGMLARTVSARYTRDTDFLYRGADPDEALEELKRVAAIDLDDYLEFRLASADRMAEGQEYRDGYRVVFSVVLGSTKRMNDVSVDLVVDQVPLDMADVVTPASRLKIEGAQVFDYLVYPVANAMADKVCATMQTYSGDRCSSRVRDLVDLAVYATTEDIDGSSLSKSISLEARLRKLGQLGSFEVPSLWREARHASIFTNSAKEAQLPTAFRSVSEAEALVKACVDPAIRCEVDGMTWSHADLAWR